MRLDYRAINGKAFNQIASANKYMASIDPALRAMVELRISQINGCAYCVDEHSQQARAAGMKQQKLDAVAAWRESQFFDERERAALTWAESLPHVSWTHADDDAYSPLVKYFSDREIVDLTLIVAGMNFWNRLAIGMREVPEPREE